MKKILLIITILFLITITLYKFVFSESKNPATISVKVGEEKKVLEEETIKDKEKYAENIISEKITSLDYDLIVNDVGISGRIYISKDGYIYIYDSTNNIYNKVSDKKFITLKEKYNLNGLLDIYAISTEYKLYHIYMFNTIDIKTAKINEILTEYKVLNFTSLNFKTINILNSNDIIVLSNDGNIYDAITGIRYNDKILSLSGYYYIYDDNTIANIFGNMIKDENGKYFKIKNYIEIFENNGIFKDVNSVIITKDNKLLYTEKNINEITIYNKIINKIDYEIINEDTNQMKITITFQDNKKIILNGMFYQDYYGLD